MTQYSHYVINDSGIKLTLYTIQNIKLGRVDLRFDAIIAGNFIFSNFVKVC